MRFSGSLLSAIFLDRPNRFLGNVQINGKNAKCYVPNPGRMRELLFPGAKVYLLEKSSEKRKTRYNIVLVEYEGSLVSIDSTTPNRVVAESILLGAIDEFHGFNIEKREHTYKESRLDFLLNSTTVQMLLEVKSCTLVKNGIGFFPDAPTKRGSKHLDTLTQSLTIGRAAIFFLVQREDAKCLKPNQETDLKFADKLREAYNRGVEIYAYNCFVTVEGVFIKERIPIIL
jgi:sugar fermentation stimulation protein A